MTAYPPVTDASVRAAKLAQQRERDEVFRVTGIRIRDPWDSPAEDLACVQQGAQHLDPRLEQAGGRGGLRLVEAGAGLRISAAIGRAVYGAECRREGQR